MSAMNERSGSMPSMSADIPLKRALNDWSQIVPICMPWANDANYHYNCLNSDVMQFTAANAYGMPGVSGVSGVTGVEASARLSATSTANNASANCLWFEQSVSQHTKRHIDSADDMADYSFERPHKQHINEDKVAEIFDHLCIAENKRKAVCDPREEDYDEEFADTDSEDDYDLNERVSAIELADELQSAIKVKHVTDRLIEDEFDKLSKAVVLWRPAVDIIARHLSDELNSDQSESQSLCSHSPNNSLPNSKTRENMCADEWLRGNEIAQNDSEMDI